MSENRCPSCRRELPVADGTFCPYCGAALAKGDELPEPVRAADLVSRFSWDRREGKRPGEKIQAAL